MEVSPHCAAEKKYRNIAPWLLHCVGLPGDEFKSRGSCQKSRLSKDTGVTFNSIPAVCFLPRSQNLVTSEFATPKFPECRIQILDKKGKLLNSFPTEVERRGSSTFGVSPASDDDSYIAACTGRGVAIWSTEGKLVANMTSDDVQNCCHITHMKCGLLATTCITDMRGRCVTLWDQRSGKIASQFASRPEIVELNPLKATQKIIIRNNHIRLPWFLTSNSKDEIFISDRNSKCIKVFDTRNQRYIKCFDTSGFDTRVKKSIVPQGLCTDENENLIVVDSNTKSLLLFDPKGSFIRPLTRKAEFDLYGEPWAIAMTTSPQFHRPICRSKCRGNDNARTLAVSMATPKPAVGIYKLSFCPHYTSYV
ncbi:uncharacterized protein LOC120340359 [Styela clava]